MNLLTIYVKELKRANMSVIIKTCVEKLVPKSGNELAGTNFWPPNKVLRTHFLGGVSTVVQEKVRHYISLWQPYINLKLEFVNDPSAEIRIGFNMDGTSWSAVGMDALNKRYFPNETLNLGWLTPETEDEEYSRIVLHEFGHALGCLHEHQNPSFDIPWDREKVYQYYFQTQGWNKTQVDQNIFLKWSRNFTQFSSFDEKSIMLYPIPKELTTNGYEVGLNKTLSDIDKGFIATIYPTN